MKLKGLLISMAVMLLFVSAFAEEKRFNIPIDNSPQKGLKDAPVTIIEFLDFQ